MLRARIFRAHGAMPLHWSNRSLKRSTPAHNSGHLGSMAASRPRAARHSRFLWIIFGRRLERHVLLRFDMSNLDKARRLFRPMTRHCAELLRAFVMLVAIGGAASAGPFEDAVGAYQRGDYALALWLWHPLAE